MLEDSLQCAAIIVYGVMTESAKKKPMLGGYLAQRQDARGRERYLEKLAVIGGVDLYEIPRKDWTDDVDLWPASRTCTWECTWCYLLVRTQVTIY